MKNVFAFLKSRMFLRHLGVALLALIAVFWLVFEGLDIYTRHGKTVTVPSFNNLKVRDLTSFIHGKQLKYLVIDSIFDTKRDKGIVIKQEPEAGSKVKPERTIYLYVTSVMPPRIAMPRLEDRSLRQAVALLETYGLKLAKPVKRKPDVCNGCVLSQEYKGKRIAEGAMIERGSEIVLTIGEGREGGGSVGIPNLIGLTRRQAVQRLNENNLSEGAMIFDKKTKEKQDTAAAVVYRQNPAAGEDHLISPGSSIDCYLTTDKTRLHTTSDTTNQHP